MFPSCRVIVDFKKGYKLRTSMVKYGKCDLVTDFHSILTRWKNHFFHLLNIHGANVVRQREIQTAESLVSEPSVFMFEMAVEKLKRHKSPGIDRNPAELIKTRGRTSRSEVNKFINFNLSLCAARLDINVLCSSTDALVC